ncbi:cobalamin biosynthesis protein [Tardiphaga robiniae]|nr:cobalamin biosynthesis protein [Tardiphaga robiniae]QND75184.1 cobalamin biosynthesis protein [Tardiphaga robiniae]
MIVAGIGCRRGAPSDDIVSLIFAALSNFGIAHEDLIAIATETLKAEEQGLANAARFLSVPLVLCPLSDLGRVTDRIITHSLRVQAIKGVPSIAEASALVAAGHNARLLGARIVANNITCAIAIGEGS